MKERKMCLLRKGVFPKDKAEERLKRGLYTEGVCELGPMHGIKDLLGKGGSISTETLKGNDEENLMGHHSDHQKENPLPAKGE